MYDITTSNLEEDSKVYERAKEADNSTVITEVRGRMIKNLEMRIEAMQQFKNADFGDKISTDMQRLLRLREAADGPRKLGIADLRYRHG